MKWKRSKSNTNKLSFWKRIRFKYKLSFIRKYKLGEVLQRVGHSGFCDYRLVRFDLEKLAEYDREGVKKFLAEQEGGHA